MEVISVEPTIQEAKKIAIMMRLITECDFTNYLNHNASNCEIDVLGLRTMHNFKDDQSIKSNYWMNCPKSEFNNSPIICCYMRNIAPPVGPHVGRGGILLSGNDKILAAYERFGDNYLLKARMFMY
jgi:hypothetical protein